MKHSSILLSCIAGFSAIHSAQNPDLTPQVAIVQTSLDNIITQANLDPIVAQALTDEINNLTQEASANIQQDMREIRAAATFTTLLETAQHMAKLDPSLANLKPFISSLKYSAHVNTIHKLLMGAFPGQFKDTAYYTDPYTESIGFILNDYVCNIITTALVVALAPTSFGKALGIDITAQKTTFATRIAAGLIAQCAWLLQKKFIVFPLLQQNQNNTANSQQA